MPARLQQKEHTLVKIPGRKGVFRQTPKGLVRERRERYAAVDGYLGGGPPRVKRLKTGTAEELFFKRKVEDRGRGTAKAVVNRRRKQRKENAKRDDFGNK